MTMVGAHLEWFDGRTGHESETKTRKGLRARVFPG